MGLTKTQSPKIYTPAYNDQWLTYLSDQIAITDFKYHVEVSVNSTLVGTYDILQRPDGYMVFNAKDVVKKYVANYFNPFLAGVTEAVNNSVNVSIVTKEYYSGAYHGTDTVTYSAWNGCLKYQDFRDYDHTDYVSGYLNNVSFLSKSGGFEALDNKIAPYSDFYAYFYAGSVDSIYYTVKNASGLTVGTFSYTLTSPSTTKIFVVNLGYYTCTIDQGITLEDGYSIVVDFKDVSSNILSTYTLNISDICSKYDVYCLYYLTRNGEYDYLFFEGKSSIRESKQSSKVKLNRNTLTSGTYGSTAYAHEVFNVGTMTTRSMTLSTGWISQSQSSKADELFDSPVHYLYYYDAEKEQYVYKPVNLTDNTYNIYRHISQPLISIQANIDFDITEERQRII